VNDVPLDPYSQANQRWWDEAVPVHVASEFYDVAGFKAGKSSLLPVEVEELGDVSGKTMLHLQCHFGLDTLSWARKGAIVTGIDFSGPAIEAARRLATETGIAARSLQSDLFAAPALLDEEFDIVFTSYGVLIWLADIRAWAGIVAGFLKPGGTFYIIEGHPLLAAFPDEPEADGRLALQRAYFHSPEPTRWEDDGSYAAAAHFENNVTYEYNHTLGDIISALSGAGLRIDFLHEHPFAAWARFSTMKRADDGYFYLPDRDVRFPLSFSLMASKPLA